MQRLLLSNSEVAFLLAQWGRTDGAGDGSFSTAKRTHKQVAQPCTLYDATPSFKYQRYFGNGNRVRFGLQ